MSRENGHDVGRSPANSGQPVLQRFPRRCTGPARVDDDKAVVAREHVHEDIAQPAVGYRNGYRPASGANAAGHGEAACAPGLELLLVGWLD